MSSVISSPAKQMSAARRPLSDSAEDLSVLTRPGPPGGDEPLLSPLKVPQAARRAMPSFESTSVLLVGGRSLRPSVSVCQWSAIRKNERDFEGTYCSTKSRITPLTGSLYERPNDWVSGQPVCIGSGSSPQSSSICPLFLSPRPRAGVMT